MVCSFTLQTGFEILQIRVCGAVEVVTAQWKIKQKNYLQDPADDPGCCVKATWEASLLAHAWRIYSGASVSWEYMAHFSLSAFPTADAWLLCSFVLFALLT